MARPISSSLHIMKSKGGSDFPEPPSHSVTFVCMGYQKISAQTESTYFHVIFRPDKKSILSDKTVIKEI